MSGQGWPEINDVEPVRRSRPASAPEGGDHAPPSDHRRPSGAIPHPGAIPTPTPRESAAASQPPHFDAEEAEWEVLDDPQPPKPQLAIPPVPADSTAAGPEPGPPAASTEVGDLLDLLVSEENESEQFEEAALDIPEREAPEVSAASQADAPLAEDDALADGGSIAAELEQVLSGGELPLEMADDDGDPGGEGGDAFLELEDAGAGDASTEIPALRSPESEIVVYALEAEMTQAACLPLRWAGIDDDKDLINGPLSAAKRLRPNQRVKISLAARPALGYRQAARDWIALAEDGSRRPPAEIELGSTAARSKASKRQTGEVLVERVIVPLASAVFKATLSLLSLLKNVVTANSRLDTRGAKPARPKAERDADAPVPPSEAVQAQIAAAEERLKKLGPYWECALRIVVWEETAPGDSSRRVKKELKVTAAKVAAGYDRFADQRTGQSLKWTKADVRDGAFNLMPTRPRGSLILSAEEANLLAHLPLRNPSDLRVSRMAIPALAPKHALRRVADYRNPEPGLIPIGLVGDEPKAMGHKEISRHLLVVGKPGSGKSTWAEWECLSLAKAGGPLILIDPHGQLADNVLLGLCAFCPERVKDILMVDVGGGDDYTLAYNPIAGVQSEEDVEVAVQSVMAMLAEHFTEASAPRAYSHALNAITAMASANMLIEDPIAQLTMLDVPEFFSLEDDELRTMIADPAICASANVQQAYGAEGRYGNLSKKDQLAESSPVIQRFHRISLSKTFARVFATENRLDWNRMLSEDRIVLLKMARHKGGRSGRELGNMLSNMVLPAIISELQNLDRGASIVIDESPVVARGNAAELKEILAEARKYRVGLTLLAQYPGQFSDADSSLEEAILMNTNTKAAFTLDGDTEKRLVNSLGEGSLSPQDFTLLPDYNFYANVLIDDGSYKGKSGPFLARGFPPIDADIPAEVTNGGAKLAKDPTIRARQLEVIERSRQEVCVKTTVADSRLDTRKRTALIKTALARVLAERTAQRHTRDAKKLEEERRTRPVRLPDSADEAADRDEEHLDWSKYSFDDKPSW